MPLSLRLPLACCALLLCVPTQAAGAQTGHSKSKKKAPPAPSATEADPLAPLVPPKAAPAKAAHAKTEPAKAPPPAPAPAASPVPPAPPTAAPAPEGYRSVEAYAPADPAADARTAKAAEGAQAPPRRLRLLPRVGVAVPRTELGVGPLAGAEIGYRLPVLDDRLRISLGAAYSFASFKGSRIVPGRGLDPAFIQNTTLVPVELIVSADVLPQERFDGWGLAVGLGYGLYFTSSDISTLGGRSTEPSLAHAFVVALRATRALGPGSLLVDVRYSEMRGDLGVFDHVGIATFSGFSFCLGYAFDVL